MPSGFYPSQEYRASATVQDSDTTKKFISQVLTNGTCKIIHNTVSSNIVWMGNTIMLINTIGFSLNK